MRKRLIVWALVGLCLAVSGCLSFRRAIGGVIHPIFNPGQELGVAVEFHPRDHRERVQFALDHNDPDLPLPEDWVMRQVRVARSHEFPDGLARMIQTRYLSEIDRWPVEVPHNQVFRGDDRRLYAVLDFPLRARELSPDGVNPIQNRRCLAQARNPQECEPSGVVERLLQAAEDTVILERQIDRMIRRFENRETPQEERRQLRRELTGSLSLREEMIRERDQLARQRDLQLSDPQDLVGLIAASDLFAPYAAAHLDGLTEGELRFLCQAEVLWRQENRTARQGRGEVNYVVRSRAALPLAAEPAAPSELEPGA